MGVEEFQELVRKTNARSHSTNRHIEHNMQVECVNWFKANFAAYAPFFWSTPNGGYRSRKTAKEMKLEGQKAGVPDLQLAYPCNGYHGLFIEMKKSRIGKKGQLIDKGTLSDHQEEVIANLRRVGYRVEVCYSVQQFKDIINNYLIHKP